MPIPHHASSIPERHVTTDISDLVEVNTEACLAVLTSSENASGDHTGAQRRLRQIACWFDGSPQQVADLIDAIASLDPVRRNRRKVILTAAWAKLLTARRNTRSC